MTRRPVWPPDPRRFTIMQTDPNDQPPFHLPGKPWLVIHPTGLARSYRKESRFRTHAEALQFVLGQPEVIRRNRKARQ